MIPHRIDPSSWSFSWWAAYCDTCRRETTDEPKCRDCGQDLKDSAKRWPDDPPLAPDMLDALWPNRDSLEADD